MELSDYNDVLSSSVLARIRKDLPGRFSEVDVLARYWSRVKAAMEGRVMPPYEVLIHPSSSCNLRCSWCIGDYVPAKSGFHELRVIDASKSAPRLADTLSDPNKMLAVINGILDYEVPRSQDPLVTGMYRVEAVSFSGLIGEPLIARRAVLEAMKVLVDKKVRTGIFTNGILMDQEVQDVFREIDYVHVSLDAASSYTYSATKFHGRKKGQEYFDQVVENLRKFAASRRKSNLNASYILYPENFDEVYSAAVLLKDLGVECLRVKQDNSGSRPLTDEQRIKAVEMLDRIESELVDSTFQLVRIHQLEDKNEVVRNFDRCTITDLMAAVGSDGHLYPCNYHPRPGGATYGSVVEHSFQEVWEGSRRATTRPRLPSICPKVCDPFKNRANSLLAAIWEIRDRSGIESAEALRDTLVAQISQ